MSWIKVDERTPLKPEMNRIMTTCHCVRGEAFLAFFKFYCWADGVTVDGRIDALTEGVADEIAGLKGFGRALRLVGWVRYEDGVGVITNFGRHNGKSAKKRLLAAERAKLHRLNGEGMGEMEEEGRMAARKQTN